MLHETRRGLFIVFEGIDGSGQDTQLEILYSLIKKLDKYQDVLATHEPWRSAEIKRKLLEEKDAYSNAEDMAQLYIADRTEHTYVLINPNLNAEAIVLSSRYKMSTCAFQQAQGLSLDYLLKLHDRQHNGIIIPDLTFFLDIKGDVAEARRHKRGAPPEKFEFREFLDRANENYNALCELSKTNPNLFGKVIKIDGNPDIPIVAKSIENAFVPFYREWKGLDDISWTSVATYGRDTREGRKR